MPNVDNKVQARGDVVTVDNPDGSVRVGIVLGCYDCGERSVPRTTRTRRSRGIVIHTVLVGLDQMAVFRFEGSSFIPVFW